MPTLNWIGKQAVENHDKEIPYKLIKCEETVGDKDTGNLIVQGDNLEALKALLPYYAGRVKCIYIDPPYNTGNEGWAYNDNVNTPEIKEWLNKVVGKEGEDLSRHDKWLCMMYPRLKLLREFLKEDGVIFVSIDDNEQANLKTLMDEIFGENNFIINFIWKKKSTSTNVEGAHVSSLTDYIICYGKSKLAKIKQRIKLKETRKYDYEDEEGKYRLTIIEKKHAGSYKRDSMRFEILGRKPREGKRWQIGEDKSRLLELKNRFIIDNDIVKLKIYDFEDKDTFSAQPNLLDNHGSTDSAAKLINNDMFGIPELFDNPKPPELINHLILISSENNSLILDSFTGSGTTGHSVLQLNKEDRGNRRFILIEMVEKICREVTTERVKRVINGYEVTKTNGTKEKVEGLGGGFKYCKLGEPLFDELGNIRQDVKFIDLAHHVFFSETGVPIEKKHLPLIKGETQRGSAFIGEYKGIGYYLLFNGILGDKSINGGNVLTSKVLDKLPKYKGKKIIFGEGCRLGAQRLRKENITFKQIPYEIKVS